MKKATLNVEDTVYRANSNLALLARLASAEQLADRGGTSIELDQDAWRAIETMVLDARTCVAALNEEIERLEKRGAA